MLHIRCGDDILGRLKEAGLPGEFIRWADALCQGPTPAGKQPDEWRRIRAQHATDFYGIPVDEGVEFLRKQDEALERFRNHDEVLLWFEHDLFDQIVLVYLLDWFSKHELRNTKLSLICPDRHIGNMSVQELAQLYPTRRQVTPDELSLASRAWQAFCAANPSAIEALFHENTSALPHVGPAFRRHLQEFPSVKNGLGCTEQAALEIISTGVCEPRRLFQEVQNREERFWLGDTMFWPYLEELASATIPLVRLKGNGPWPSRQSPSSARRIFTTAIGEAVLSGQQDRVKLNGINRWFGGVHLHGKRLSWRWDQDRQALVRYDNNNG